MRDKAQRVASPAKSRLQNVGVTGKTSHQISNRSRMVIGGANMSIHVTIFPSVMEYQSIE